MDKTIRCSKCNSSYSRDLWVSYANTGEILCWDCAIKRDRKR